MLSGVQYTVCLNVMTLQLLTLSWRDIHVTMIGLLRDNNLATCIYNMHICMYSCSYPCVYIMILILARAHGELGRTIRIDSLGPEHVS